MKSLILHETQSGYVIGGLPCGHSVKVVRTARGFTVDHGGAVSKLKPDADVLEDVAMTQCPEPELCGKK